MLKFFNSGKTRMPFRQINRWLPASAGLLVLLPQVAEAKVCVRQRLSSEQSERAVN
jgi:hypothetical protein